MRTLANSVAHSLGLALALTIGATAIASPVAAQVTAQASPQATQSAAEVPASAADSAAIRATALDYIDGWYGGDSTRMRRALHPGLAKRIVRGSRVDHMGADTLVAYAGRGGGNRTPQQLRRNEVKILDVYGNTASVRVDATSWVDYLHLGKVDGEWKIVNVLWEMRPR